MSVEGKTTPSVDEKSSSIDREAAISVSHKALGQGHGHSAEDERRLVRKLDMRIMPMACIMYLFACKLQVLSPRRCEDADGTCRS